jgi:hypothetical protein
MGVPVLVGVEVGVGGMGLGGGVETGMKEGIDGAKAGWVKNGMKVKLPKLEWTLKSEIVGLIIEASVVPHQL